VESRSVVEELSSQPFLAIGQEISKPESGDGMMVSSGAERDTRLGEGLPLKPETVRS